MKRFALVFAVVLGGCSITPKKPETMGLFDAAQACAVTRDDFAKVDSATSGGLK